MDTSSDSEPCPSEIITTTAFVHPQPDISNLDEITVVRDTTPPREESVLPEIVYEASASQTLKNHRKAGNLHFNTVLGQASKQEQSGNKNKVDLDFLFALENNNVFEHGKKQRKLMSLQDVANLTKGSKKLSHNYYTRSHTSDASVIYKFPSLDSSSDESYPPKKRISKVKTAKRQKRRLPAADVQDDTLRSAHSIDDEEIVEELYIERGQPRVTDLDPLSLTPPERRSPPKKRPMLDEIVFTSPKIQTILSVDRGLSNSTLRGKNSSGDVGTSAKFIEKKVGKVAKMTVLEEMDEENLSPILGNRPEGTLVSGHKQVVEGFVDFFSEFLPIMIEICPNKMKQLKECLNKEKF